MGYNHCLPPLICLKVSDIQCLYEAQLNNGMLVHMSY